MKKVNSKSYFFAALFLGLVGGVAQAGPIRGKSLIFLAFFYLTVLSTSIGIVEAILCDRSR